MADVLFTNVRILDGSGAAALQRQRAGAGQPHPPGRPQHARRSRPAAPTVIDGAGATLMPGMCEAHTHFSWNDAATLAGIQTMPLEEHVLWCAKVAKRYLEAGFTSCVGAACAKPRLDVVIRNAINCGPDPRARATSRRARRSPCPAASATRPCRTCRFPSSASASTSTRADEMRKAVRMFLKYGVDSIKLNLSGDNFTPRVARRHDLDERRRGRRRDATRCAMRGKRGTAHARSAASVKQALRHGIDVIYHASFADSEALDMLEAAKDRVFVAPGIAILYAMLHEAEPCGITHAKAIDDGLPDRVGRRARVAARRCTSAASACCPAATTASPSRRTARTRATSSSSSSTSASRRWRRSARPRSTAARS